MDDKEFFCNLTASFWRYYLLEPTKENFENMFSYFSEDLIMIGTGKHEFYTDLKKILGNMSGNRIVAESVIFEVIDEWYECLVVSTDIFLVYGGIWVRQQGSPEDELLIEMDTRFSLVFRRDGKKCELVHLHHSVPYSEQMQGEYYPKTMAEKTKAAITLAEEFKRKSELDLMTEIYNNVSFKHHVIYHLETCNKGNLYLFDLDHFKAVNDTYGHMKGDALLKLFANTLKETFSKDAIIGRVGGDEFAVFDCKPLSKELATKKIVQLQEDFGIVTKKIIPKETSSFSVGIVSVINTHTLFDSIFANADKALYHAKKLGRKTYYWH